ncbi:MAG: hypothetical protein AAGE89_04755 [Pseudomonadota bacterium]
MDREIYVALFHVAIAAGVFFFYWRRPIKRSILTVCVTVMAGISFILIWPLFAVLLGQRQNVAGLGILNPYEFFSIFSAGVVPLMALGMTILAGFFLGRCYYWTFLR